MYVGEEMHGTILLLQSLIPKQSILPYKPMEAFNLPKAIAQMKMLFILQEKKKQRNPTCTSEIKYCRY